MIQEDQSLYGSLTGLFPSTYDYIHTFQFHISSLIENVRHISVDDKIQDEYGNLYTCTESGFNSPNHFVAKLRLDVISPLMMRLLADFDVLKHNVITRNACLIKVIEITNK